MAETREEKKEKKKKKKKEIEKRRRVNREEGGARRKKAGWRNEGREFELNYILISRPFRRAHRDTPNIRRNLHFKLDTSCYDPEGFTGGWRNRLARLLPFSVKSTRAYPSVTETFKNFNAPGARWFLLKTSRTFLRRRGPFTFEYFTFSEQLPFEFTFQFSRRFFLCYVSS